MTPVRLLGAFFLLAVLGAILVAGERALPGPVAEASVGGTVAVDSTGDTNARDGVITLREAMLLVTGSLAVSALDAAECDQVLGAAFGANCVAANPPGAGNADKIIFNAGVFPPGNPGTIVIASPLPTLSTGNDLIEGSFTGVSVGWQALGGGTSSRCFHITSNANTIRGLEIKRCAIGIWIVDAAQNNVIGGDGEGQRNVLYDTNASGAIVLGGAGTLGNSIIGNYIGTDGSGNVAMGHKGGIRINSGAQSNTIVGNVISGGSGNAAISIRDPGTDGNIVKSNYLGTNASGDAALPNLMGIQVQLGASNNIIGGSSEGEGNVISGNTFAGVLINPAGTEGNLFIGNYIGTDASGEAPIPNLTGIHFFGNGAKNNTFGGVQAGEGNLIAYNTEDGVLVKGAETTGNTIRGNSIHSNGGKGIALIDGANTQLAAPVITGFGSVTGTACPNCTIDVYSDSEGEGEVYEGTTVADGGGDWTLGVTPQGPFVTATATDADGNTSEFSEPADPSATPTPPGQTPTPTPTLAPGETPTATPAAPTPIVREVVWGDNQCDGEPNPIDSLITLRYDAGLFVQLNGCPPMSEDIEVLSITLAGLGEGDGDSQNWGNVDCDDQISPVDSLKILRYDAGLSVTQEQGCPPIGDGVQMQYAP